MQWAINQQQYTIYMSGKILIPMHKLLKTNLKNNGGVHLKYTAWLRRFIYSYGNSAQKKLYSAIF